MISQQGVQQIQKRGTDSKVPRFFVVIFFIVFSGVVSPVFAKKKSKALKSNRSIIVRQAEAQMADMPLPVGGVLIPVITKTGDVVRNNAVRFNAVGSDNTHESAVSGGRACSDTIILTYRITATRESLIRFYEEEMMRLGWNKLVQSSGDEELLVFESPLQVAIIQMRPEKPKKGWKRNKKIILTLHETAKENEKYL
jgi:hypothetical protein